MNYKALNTDFTEEDLKLSWKEWIWDKCPYWFRKFIRKFRRWWKYTLHLWKENPWNENYEFFRIIQLQLSIMADEFENRQITMSAEQDAKDMRKVIILLSRYMDKYYSTKYYEEGKFEEPTPENMEELQEWLMRETKWKESYTTEGWHKSMERDYKALELACKILVIKSPGWWQ